MIAQSMVSMQSRLWIKSHWFVSSTHALLADIELLFWLTSLPYIAEYWTSCGVLGHGTNVLCLTKFMCFFGSRLLNVWPYLHFLAPNTPTGESDNSVFEYWSRWSRVSVPYRPKHFFENSYRTEESLFFLCAINTQTRFKITVLKITSLQFSTLTWRSRISCWYFNIHTPKTGNIKGNWDVHIFAKDKI